MICVYAKCEVERGTFTRKKYGCPDHGMYERRPVNNYCSTCGNPSIEVEVEYYGYPDLHVLINYRDTPGSPSKLGVHQTLNTNCFYVFSWNRDDCERTSIVEYGKSDVVIDTELISTLIETFTNQYQEEINILKQYGTVEIHFGYLNMSR